MYEYIITYYICWELFTREILNNIIHHCVKENTVTLSVTACRCRLPPRIAVGTVNLSLSLKSRVMIKKKKKKKRKKEEKPPR